MGSATHERKWSDDRTRFGLFLDALEFMVGKWDIEMMIIGLELLTRYLLSGFR